MIFECFEATLIYTLTYSGIELRQRLVWLASTLIADNDDLLILFEKSLNVVSLMRGLFREEPLQLFVLRSIARAAALPTGKKYDNEREKKKEVDHLL